jgi:hypothetical protein
VISFEPPVQEHGKTVCGSICVEGGTTYTEVVEYLSAVEPPCALKMLASVTQATVAGACATGTHGSGIQNQNLASHITAIEIVTATGELMTYDRTCDEFWGAVTSVGSVGVVSKISLEVVPFFEGQLFIFTVPIECIFRHWDTLVAGGDSGGSEPHSHPFCDAFSVLCFFDRGFCVLLLKHFAPHWDASIAARAPNYADTLFGGKAGDIHGLFPGVEDPSWTGPWYDTVSVFIKDGEEADLGDGSLHFCGQQVEIFVPIENAVDALKVAGDMLKNWPIGDPLKAETEETGILFHTELRIVKGDPTGQWLSPHPTDSLVS